MTHSLGSAFCDLPELSLEIHSITIHVYMSAHVYYVYFFFYIQQQAKVQYSVLAYWHFIGEINQECGRNEALVPCHRLRYASLTNKSLSWKNITLEGHAVIPTFGTKLASGR